MSDSSCTVVRAPPRRLAGCKSLPARARAGIQEQTSRRLAAGEGDRVGRVVEVFAPPGRASLGLYSRSPRPAIGMPIEASVCTRTRPGRDAHQCASRRAGWVMSQTWAARKLITIRRAPTASANRTGLQSVSGLLRPFTRKYCPSCREAPPLKVMPTKGKFGGRSRGTERILTSYGRARRRRCRL